MVPCQRRDCGPNLFAPVAQGSRGCQKRLLAKSLRRLRTIPFRAKRARGYDRASRKRETFRERHTRAMEGFAKWDFWVEPGVEDEEEDDGW